MSKKIIAVSGGFDPIHVGHVRMIQEAAALGDQLVVILNNDHWLMKKKGYVFMPQEQRKEIIEAIAGVSAVVLTNHEPDCADMSVCDALKEIKPDIFANGGDRFADNIPEAVLARELGIETIFNIGHGGKVQSSSWLTAEDRDVRECFCRSGLKYVQCHGK
ncbi:adenylyltransferase/cytidyltransferase family protein [Candidatus Uhrbacteria bacterium]|nr:adenylyltransferase/cytidyltransferase family protein [Candidatus Uhrbacteria bacterium]